MWIKSFSPELCSSSPKFKFVFISWDLASPTKLRTEGVYMATGKLWQLRTCVFCCLFCPNPSFYVPLFYSWQEKGSFELKIIGAHMLNFALFKRSHSKGLTQIALLMHQIETKHFTANLSAYPALTLKSPSGHVGTVISKFGKKVCKNNFWSYQCISLLSLLQLHWQNQTALKKNNKSIGLLSTASAGRKAVQIYWIIFYNVIAGASSCLIL